MAYGSAEMLGWLVEEQGIAPHIPVWDKSKRTDGTFSREDFVYEPATDSYTCPGGKELRTYRRNFSKPRKPNGSRDGFIRHRASKHDSDACPLPDTSHLPVQCVSSDDFQRCANCAIQTMGLVLRHWRFSWSLTCENCGRPLVARYPADDLSDRLRVRAARGAAVLKTAVHANDLRRMRRISRTFDVLKIVGLENPASLTPRCQLQRSEALAAVDVCATRPLLGASIQMRGNDRALWELRRAFPQHRRLIEKVRKQSQYLERRLPRQQKAEPAPKQETQNASRPVASEGALQAARLAISELGSDADHHALLERADAIWRRQSCVKN